MTPDARGRMFSPCHGRAEYFKRVAPKAVVRQECFTCIVSNLHSQHEIIHAKDARGPEFMAFSKDLGDPLPC